MSLITPNSQIKLYSDVEITDGLEIVFKSKAGQDAYFKSKLKASNVTCTYIKKTGKCRIEFPTSTVSQCNFITFTNASFENVTFYARVTNWEYVNNVTSDIMYEIDWFQTYMFNVEYKDAKIEREHLSEDDFQALEKNPWKTGIYEMETEEGLAVDKNMYDFPTAGAGGAMQKIDVGMLYAVMQVSPYEDEDNTFEAILRANSSGLYSPLTGQYIPGTKGTPPYNVLYDAKVKFPNPNYIAFFSISKEDDSAMKGLANLVKMLTVNNASHNIISLYAVPLQYIQAFLFETFNNPKYPSITVQMVNETEYVNKKLYRAPYNFLEMHLANESKEYQYENFVNLAIAEAPVDVKFYIAASLENIPMLAIIPESYKFQPEDGADIQHSLNVDERMDYKNIPHVAYNIDDYSSFLGSQYQTALTTSDNEIYANQITSSAALGNNVLRNDVGAIQEQGPVLSAVYFLRDMITQIKNSIDYNSGGTDYINKFAQNQTQLDLLNEANSVKKGDFVSNVYGQAKRVLGGSRYVAGNTGTLELYAGIAGNVGAPVVCKRQIKPAILEQYDKFFTNYGYTSNRIGVPRVCHYIKATDTQPHFQDGYTYVKTSGMQVISNVKPASDYIESMFDRGCKFKKGD